MRPYAWMRRAGEIAEKLADEPALIDRERIEQIFGIPRRTAIDLLHAAGGEKKGGAFVIRRERLVHFVHERMGNIPSKRPESGLLVETSAAHDRGPKANGGSWVTRTAEGVTIACGTATDLVKNLRRLAAELQDPGRRQALLKELGLQ